MDPKEDVMNTMMSRISFRAVACVALALLAVGGLPRGSSPAFAQGAPTICRARDNLLTQLEQNYGEVPVAIGVADGALIELLTAKDGMTWTIILTSPKGMSCLIASGDGWRPIAPTPTGPSV
jgi:hypothetical protein